jgi:hypothetical protein
LPRVQPDCSRTTFQNTLTKAYTCRFLSALAPRLYFPGHRRFYVLWVIISFSPGFVNRGIIFFLLSPFWSWDEPFTPVIFNIYPNLEFSIFHSLFSYTALEKIYEKRRFSSIKYWTFRSFRTIILNVWNQNYLHA